MSFGFLKFLDDYIYGEAEAFYKIMRNCRALALLALGPWALSTFLLGSNHPAVMPIGVASLVIWVAFAALWLSRIPIVRRREKLEGVNSEGEFQHNGYRQF